MPPDATVFTLQPEAAAWIREHVIPPRVRSYGHGPHHCPVWGSWCGRCPEAVCSSCRLGYHRCSGPVYAAYPETGIFDAQGSPVVGPHLWDALGARWARVWLAPRTCACGCAGPPAADDRAPASPRGSGALSPDTAVSSADQREQDTLF
ncbi:hypothetical protein OG215_36415 (plasmid) [Streptomyces globisporus]|uniref:hypothetical protein n=1 Tax=Streptomyces globisporus TaxID=1908 RepID=UPI002F913EF3|nr:hypothetical protein OG215_36415 [Streptomyces globisporus]